MGIGFLLNPLELLEQSEHPESLPAILQVPVLGLLLTPLLGRDECPTSDDVLSFEPPLTCCVRDALGVLGVTGTIGVGGSDDTPAPLLFLPRLAFFDFDPLK
ncbi:hypothetical protein ONZ45_g14023 [Pleurotus djamor]|nr:hypothetical protein ONZ45_g14023 [Pleurotus djamor]